MQIEDGTVAIVAEDWLTFLYEVGVYDPKEINKGLLKGTFLLRVSHFLMILISTNDCESIRSSSTFLLVHLQFSMRRPLLHRRMPRMPNFTAWKV